ncbi:transcriptional regulator [soil metagenome]
MSHPSQLLDDRIHQRVRLGILAVLSEAGRADFTHLRSVLELTDGNLSRHLAVLEKSGYVRVVKEYQGKRPRTWVASTRSGRAALAEHLATLKKIIEQVGGSP